MEKIHIAIAFVKNNNRYLIVRRSEKVEFYKGMWSGVSGFVENSSPLFRALKEIEEETGLSRSDVKFIKAGKEIEIPDRKLGKIWIAHPFLFELRIAREIKLNWENIDYKWIKPSELDLFETVPKLEDVLLSLL